MIRYKRAIDNGIEIEQTSGRPIVYLDNWALNLFSSDNSLGGRFTSALNKFKGTLTISFVSLLEITKREDEKQIAKIMELIDSIDGGFIETDAGKVIRREEENKNNRGAILLNSLCMDVELLKNYVLHAHDPLKPFKISEAVLELRNGIKEKGYIKENFEENLFPTIEKTRNDSAALLRAKDRFKANKMVISQFPCTKILLSQCIDYIAINEEMRMGNKEWRDVWHTIVPVAYCDFVLIDSRWTNFIKSTGLGSPNIAKVYNQNEVEIFFTDLEVFKIEDKN